MNEKIGATIKKFRKTNHLTQADLGGIVGVSHATIGRYESDDITPPTEAIKKMGEIFGTEFTAEVMGIDIEEELKKTRSILNEGMTPLITEMLEHIEMSGFIGYIFETEDGVHKFWQIEDNDVKGKPFVVDDEKLTKLIKRNFEHLRIELKALLEEQKNGTEK